MARQIDLPSIWRSLDDTFIGDEHDNTFESGLGDDTYVFGDGWGSDTITDIGGTADTLDFSALIADLVLRIYTASLILTDGSNSLDVTLNDLEQVRTGSGNDHFIFMEDGAQVSGGAGMFDAGSGVNRLDYQGYTATPAVVDLPNGTATGTAGISAIRDVFGGAADDVLTGDGQDNILRGRFGDDIITGAGGIDTLDESWTGLNLAIDLSQTLAQVTGIGSDTITGVENLITGSGDDRLCGDAQDNHLQGGSGNDTYCFYDGFGIDTVTDTGGANDTFDFSALTLGLTFNIGTGPSLTVLETVNLDQVTNLGTAIETLIGGSAPDNFIFADGAALAGGLDGRTGADTIDWSAYSTPRNVTLDSPGPLDGFAGSEASSGAFTNINILLGTGADTLTGAALDALWTLDAATSYQVGGVSLDFSGFAQLNGGGGHDIFEFWNTVLFDGSLNGGSGADRMDYSHYLAAVDVNLQTAHATGLSGTFAGIEALTGSPQVDTFIGQDLPATFELDGSDRYINAAITLDLSDFEVLIGGSAADGFQIQVDSTYELHGGGGNDSFILANGVTLTGSVEGGLGLDTLDLGAWTSDLTALLTAPDLSSGFDGNVDGLSGGFASLDRLVGGTSLVNSLTGLDADAIWTLNTVGDNSYASAGQILYFINFNNLQGGSAADTFYFADGVLFDGSLDGGNGIDTLNYWMYTTPVEVDLGTGIVTGLTGLALNFENATGGSGDDTLVGNDIDNILDGGPGDDILSGLGGDDTLITGTGDNTLYGGDGYDTGIIHYDATFHIPLNDVENLIFLERPAAPPAPPPMMMILNVLSGQRVNFKNYISDYILLRLPEGSSVLFNILCCDQASLDALTGQTFLPGVLRPGRAPVFGMRVNAWLLGHALDWTSRAMLITFRLPDWMRGLNLAIVRWDPISGGWIELDTFITPDGRWARTASYRTGVYLLIMRGVEQSLVCSGQAELVLPNGVSLSLPCGLADLAILTPQAAWQLPGSLPDGLDFISAVQVWALLGGAELSEASLDVSFPVPDLYLADELVILHWQAGAWTELPTTIAAGHAGAHGELTGLYILAIRMAPVASACEAGTLVANAGPARVTAPCSAAGSLMLKPELAETLPGPLYEGNHFLAGVTVDLPSGTSFQLDFDLPDSTHTAAILRYDAGLYYGAGGWVIVADGPSAEPNQPGTYILVTP
ncbi:MAG: M10 family metallopeptidase C-terminal domain-containing protein [Chloroflexota bacterium]